MLDSLLKVGVCDGSTVSVKPGSQSGFEWIEFRFSVIEITSLGLKKSRLIEMHLSHGRRLF